MKKFRRIIIAAFGIYLSLIGGAVSDKLTENEKSVNSRNFALLWLSSNYCWYGVDKEMTKYADDIFKVDLYLNNNIIIDESLDQKQQKFLDNQKYKDLVRGNPYEFTYWENVTDVSVAKFPNYDYSGCEETEADELAVEWNKKNPWFLVNEEMSDFAFAIHGKLVENDVDPVKDAKIYYSEIDKQMRLRFPEYGWDD